MYISSTKIVNSCKKSCLWYHPNNWCSNIHKKYQRKNQFNYALQFDTLQSPWQKPMIENTLTQYLLHHYTVAFNSPLHPPAIQALKPSKWSSCNDLITTQYRWGGDAISSRRQSRRLQQDKTPQKKNHTYSLAIALALMTWLRGSITKQLSSGPIYMHIYARLEGRVHLSGGEDGGGVGLRCRGQKWT